MCFPSKLHKLPLWSKDARRADFQADSLSRSIFTHLPKELREKLVGWPLQLVKPMNGFKESGGYCFHFYISACFGKFHMIASAIDRSLFYCHDSAASKNWALNIVVGSLVDDSLRTGTTEFAAYEKELHKAFDMGEKPLLSAATPVNFLELKFVWMEGVNCDKMSPALPHSRRLGIVSVGVPTFTEVKTATGAISWLSLQTRPDISYRVAQPSQHTRATPSDRIPRQVTLLI